VSMHTARMQEAHFAACAAEWRRPRARILEGKAIVGVAHAAIDVSDGLAHDAWQLAEASKVGIVLDARAVVASAGEDLVVAASMLGREVLELALNGGEDYALLAASRTELPGFVLIGTVVEHDGGARVMLATSRGTAPLSPRGFDHFG
jgi:thiamine-monophosphate kinase